MKIKLLITLASALLIGCVCVFAQSFGVAPPKPEPPLTPQAATDLIKMLRDVGKPERTDSPVSRFQLIPATVEFISTNGVTRGSALFKLDTATGRTWTYKNTFIDGRLSEGWELVWNFEDQAAIQEIKKQLHFKP